MVTLKNILILLILVSGCADKKKLLTTNDILNSTLSSKGLGAIKLGDSFSDILKIIPKHSLFTTGEEGYFWDAIKVDLGQGEWVIIETDNGNFGVTTEPSSIVDKSNPNYNYYGKSDEFNKIKTIKTNSKRIKTTLGIKIGMTIKAATDKGEKIDLFDDLGGVNFILQKENIVFRVADKWEKSYFDKGGEFPSCLDNNATIKELKIH